MKVIEIFKSIDGEGLTAGYPATFIRLMGCNLRCTFCDTVYSFEGSPYTEMSVQEIVDECIDLGVPHITLTGGEPLLHKDVENLILKLLATGFKVNVETNGTIIPNIYHDRIVYTYDYKCPGSGMHKRMNAELFGDPHIIRPVDVVKFVVGSKEDLEFAENIIHKYDLDSRCTVFLSPVFGNIEPVDIVNFMLEKNLHRCRIQLQMHKIIWDPNKRGV